MAEERDVRFVTEESFDFGILSPSDSQEEEEDEEAEGGPGGGSWSPLRGARLEEMVREATRLAAQLEQCHLPPPSSPGTPPQPRTPRSPRRETFVVKDSPVRALLPTVPAPPASTRAAPDPPSTRKVSPSCHPTTAPKGPPGARVPPSSRLGPPRSCPPRGQGAGSRGRSEPPQAGPSLGGGRGRGQPSLPPGQSKARGGAAPCPPTSRQPRARVTAVPSGHPPAPSALPRGPGRTLAGGAAPAGRAPAPRGAGAARAAPPAAGSGCKPGPPSSRVRPSRKTVVSSTPR